MTPSMPVSRAGASSVSDSPAPLGALLVGGASSRMGQDKARLRLGGTTLARRCTGVLSSVAGEVVQIGGEVIPGLGIEHLPDLRPGIGPAGGIETALSHAEGRSVVCLAVDLPLVPASLLQATVTVVGDGALIAAPRTAGRWHPLCGTYAAAVLDALAERLDRGSYGMQALADEYAVPIEGPELSALGDPGDMLFNVNTPADLARVEELFSDPG